MARQAGLKLQGIKIRPLTFFNSAFHIPNSLAQTCFMKMVYKGYNSSGVLLWCHLIEAVAPGRAEFNCICLLLFCNQFVAVLHVGIADHDVRIQSRFFQGLVFTDAHGGVIDCLAGPNG